MPTPRYSLGVGVVDNILYAVGGYNVDYLSNNQAYNPVTNTWAAKPAIPTPRFGFGVGVINGTLYAVGGQSNAAPPAVEAYTPTTNTWTTKAPLPTPRIDLGVGVVNGVLYAVGGYGYTNGDYLGTVEAYDPATDTWTTKAPMPTLRAGFGIGVINGILYAVGGNNRQWVSAVEAYDPSTNTWTTKAPMPKMRRYFGTAAIKGVLYVVGGQDSTGLETTVEAYDPVADTWTTKVSLPTPRSNVGAAVINDVLYTVGGYAQKPVSTVEAFTPPQVSVPPQFDFAGFFWPVRNAPVVNRVLAGSIVPVSFSLHGDQGLDIFAVDYPQSQRQSCNGNLTGVPTQTRTVGSVGLLYDRKRDLYVYAWKTDASWAGTCRVLSLKLNDGSIHQARFFLDGRFLQFSGRMFHLNQ